MFNKLISTSQLAERLFAPQGGPEARIAPPWGKASEASFGGSSFAPQGLVIVDVRHDLAQPDTWGEGQYRQGHLPGAVFAHVDRDLSGATTGSNGRHPLPSSEAAAKAFGRLGIDAGKQVVIYDQGPGVYASRLWWMLHWLGHGAAAVLDGGYAQWVREGWPVTTDTSTTRSTTFIPHASSAIVDTASIEASLGGGSPLLVDARAPERFRGEVEPIDPVAGHIPGAVNRPHARNMHADGTWKSPDELRAEFDALLAGRPASDVVHYCGSGVSACHNLLAMEIADLHGARLYPGSWSEWSADPSRPRSPR